MDTNEKISLLSTLDEDELTVLYFLVQIDQLQEILRYPEIKDRRWELKTIRSIVTSIYKKLKVQGDKDEKRENLKTEYGEFVYKCRALAEFLGAAPETSSKLPESNELKVTEPAPPITRRISPWTFVIGIIVIAIGLFLLGRQFLSPTPVTIPTPTTTEFTQINVKQPTATTKPEVAQPAYEFSSVDWKIDTYSGETLQMKDWVEQIKSGGLAKDWSEFPNVDFPKYGFLAKDGVEYGVSESGFCGESKCDIDIPSRYYRLITGDYDIPNIDKGISDSADTGHGIALFNVGEVTAILKDSTVLNGFTVEGRYFNGDEMPTTIRALLSNTVFNMFKEGNCGSPTGCNKVEVTFVILSGDQMLVKGKTTITR